MTPGEVVRHEVQSIGPDPADCWTVAVTVVTPEVPERVAAWLDERLAGLGEDELVWMASETVRRKVDLAGYRRECERRGVLPL